MSSCSPPPGQTRDAASLYGNWTAAWEHFGWLPEQFDIGISAHHPVEKVPSPPLGISAHHSVKKVHSPPLASVPACLLLRLRTEGTQWCCTHPSNLRTRCSVHCTFQRVSSGFLLFLSASA